MSLSESLGVRSHSLPPGIHPESELTPAKNPGDTLATGSAGPIGAECSLYLAPYPLHESALVPHQQD